MESIPTPAEGHAACPIPFINCKPRDLRPHNRAPAEFGDDNWAKLLIALISSAVRTKTHSRISLGCMPWSSVRPKKTIFLGGWKFSGS